MVIPHACPAFLKYALLVIKNVLIKKAKTIFAFMVEVHLPLSQASLREDKTFDFKTHSKLCRDSELSFLVNFNLNISALKRS